MCNLTSLLTHRIAANFYVTVTAYSAKYSALVAYKYWNCSNTKVFDSHTIFD